MIPHINQRSLSTTMLNFQDRKPISGKRVSSGLICNFKSLSRQKKAPWGTRFPRDHNDLILEGDPHSISNQLKTSRRQKPPSARNHQSPIPAKRYQYSPFKSRNFQSSHSQKNLRPFAGMLFDNYRESGQEVELAGRGPQETAASTAKKRRYGLDRENAEMQALKEYGIESNNIRKSGVNSKNPHFQQLKQHKLSPLQQVNLLGLSPVEFDANISAKLLGKASRHLDFSRNKTSKMNNTHRVWYDHSKDIDKSPDIKDKERYLSLRNTHSNRSLSSHKLFFRTKRLIEDNGCGHGGMLDKYYDLISQEKQQPPHPKPSKKPDPQRTSPLPHPPKKLGTNLDYQIQQQKTLMSTTLKRPVLQPSTSQRELILSRQVMSPTRGCLR